MPLHDDVLGELEFSEGFWNAHARRGDNDLELSIVGDHHGPDPLGRALLIEALSRFDSLVDEARAYLLKDLARQDLASRPYEFHPTGIWCGAAWQLKQRSITLTLELAGDDSGLWRVEIGPAGPIDSGRDS